MAWIVQSGYVWSVTKPDSDGGVSIFITLRGKGAGDLSIVDYTNPEAVCMGSVGFFNQPLHLVS